MDVAPTIMTIILLTKQKNNNNGSRGKGNSLIQINRKKYKRVRRTTYLIAPDSQTPPCLM